jgi:hypothetical protein
MTREKHDLLGFDTGSRAHAGLALVIWRPASLGPGAATAAGPSLGCHHIVGKCSQLETYP